MQTFQLAIVKLILKVIFKKEACVTYQRFIKLEDIWSTPTASKQSSICDPWQSSGTKGSWLYKSHIRTPGKGGKCLQFSVCLQPFKEFRILRSHHLLSHVIRFQIHIKTKCNFFIIPLLCPSRSGLHYIWSNLTNFLNQYIQKSPYPCMFWMNV